MKKYKVAVLLSAYNGEKYIKEQVDSILNQKDVDVNLIVRIDGSNDSTFDILKEYKNITILNESNVGLARSFMNLVKYANLDYDFYCFADQDDIWLENKIITGCNKIGDNNKPILYSSNQTLVNQKAEFISTRYTKNVNVSYKQILCNNLISGCTMIWNNSLQKLLLKHMPSNELLDKRIHDVWVGMVAACCGDISYDSNSYILYRQHENNVVGVKKGNRFKAIIKKFKNNKTRNGRSFLAKEILLGYSDLLPQDKKEFLENCAYYQKNRKYKKFLLKNKEIYSLTGESKRMYKLKVKFNLF